jgi:hypothetical protein
VGKRRDRDAREEVAGLSILRNRKFELDRTTLLFVSGSVPSKVDSMTLIDQTDQ